MTESRSKSETISETTKSHLLDVYVTNKYGRSTELQSKFISKGLMAEEDSVTLYSRYSKKFFKKNEEHLSNEFIKGTPDCYIGESINNAELIIDLKTSWDIFTFFRNLGKSINKMYYWQLQGYMWLTGAKKSKLVYCLVDTPEILINDEKRKLMWKSGSIDDSSKEAQEALAELEKQLTYSDIPINERVIEIEIERNDEDLEKLRERIIYCRNYIHQISTNF